jgi:ATP-binding cassette subfamily B (MDR/TAP) protein 1
VFRAKQEQQPPPHDSIGVVAVFLEDIIQSVSAARHRPHPVPAPVDTSGTRRFIHRFSGDDFIMLLLYIDDILIVGKNVSRIARIKKELSKSFAMKDLGPAKCILGMRIERDRKTNKLYLSQEKYIEKVLCKFKMDEAREVSCPLAAHFKLSKKQYPSTEKMEKKMQKVPYASAVGSLMYAMVCTRPDIAQAVSTVSRFMSNPGRPH